MGTSQPTIQGRLKIRQEDLAWDLPVIQSHVTGITKPQLKRELGNEQTQYWAVDFEATAA